MSASAESGNLSFVDTNVLVYAVSEDDPRNLAAQRLILDLQFTGRFRTSTQVLQEFFTVATRKLKRPLSTQQALRYIDEFAECPIVINDVETIRTAALFSSREPISFWDALLIAAALESGATILYTEDLQHNRNLPGLRIVNPFVS
jgi:predicted nucleic acid-binding protein